MGNSGWNRPASNQPETGKGGKAPSKWRGIAAGLAIAVPGLALCLFLFSGGDARQGAASTRGRGRIRDARPASAAKSAATSADETRKERVRRVQAEFNEQVKEYIKKSPTNNIQWVVAPLDPDDPDNALRTTIARDIGTLLSIPPGEEIPPCIPFGFMFEDDAIAAAAARGEAVVTTDGGNKRFLDDLKKWKVTIKKGDNEARIQAKNDLVDAQLELLKGIDDGMSVNDSIRAAYQYRVKAAQTRKSMIESIREIHNEDHDVAITRELIKAANKNLAEEGIIPIHEGSVIPDEDLEAAEAEAPQLEQEEKELAQ